MSPAASSAVPPPLATPPVLLRDFPGWLPPMMVKELRQGLRTRGFVGALVVFQVIMLLITLGSLATQSALSPAARGAGATAASGLFWTILGVQLVLVTPSRALGGMQLETDLRTIDLLMLTRLNAWGVVLGKWVALLAQGLLLVVAMLPYLVVRYFTDNADILADLGRCCALFGLSAVITAACLWGSGVAKGVRVLLMILIVFGIMGATGGLGPRFFGVRGAGGPPILKLFDSPIDVLNAVLVTVFFLVSAVRNIAPPAENHCLLARSLPLLAIVPAVLAELAGAHRAAGAQLAFAGGMLAVVLLFELANPRQPMASHWHDWSRRPGPRRLLGHLAMPGWPSATVFGAIGVGAWVFGALYIVPSGTPASREAAEHLAWLAFLAFGGLVFPALVQSAFRRAAPLAVYFGTILLLLVLSGIAAWLANVSTWKFTALQSLMEILPVGSFVFGIEPPRPQSDVTLFCAGSVVVGVLLAAAWQSRAYWRRLQEFEARGRVAPAA